MDFFKLHAKIPDLIFLQEILQSFSNIPYENLSKIIKLNNTWNSQDKIRLPEEIIKDYIAHKLGGTCFSLTFFLQAILLQNGFKCYPIMADMHAGKNIHCCLIVILDETKYLVDPGYLLTQPIEINPQRCKLIINEFAMVKLRHDNKNKTYDLYTITKNASKWRYRFKDIPVSHNAFLKHWFASFGRNSMNRIYLTKIVNNGLIYVRNNFMRKTTFEGKQNFNIKKNCPAAINEVFGIDKQLIEQAQAALKENLKKRENFEPLDA